MRSLILYTLLTNHTPNIFTYQLKPIKQTINHITRSIEQLQQRIQTLERTQKTNTSSASETHNHHTPSTYSTSHLQTMTTNIERHIQQANKHNQLTNLSIHSTPNPTAQDHTPKQNHTHPTTPQPPPPEYKPIQPHHVTHENNQYLQLLGLPTTPMIQRTLHLNNIPQNLCVKIPGLIHEHQKRLHLAKQSTPTTFEFPYYTWHPGLNSAEALATTFFDAGLYNTHTADQTHATQTPNTLCPLCHLDFATFRSALACHIFDPTSAYPPTNMCIITANELIHHLQVISKIHPPHKYLLNFIYLQHPKTAPRGWTIKQPTPIRGISKSHS